METTKTEMVKIFADYDVEGKAIHEVFLQGGRSVPDAEWRIKLLILELVLKSETKYTEAEILQALEDVIDTMPECKDIPWAVSRLPSASQRTFDDQEIERLFKKFLDSWTAQDESYEFVKKYFLLSKGLQAANLFSFFDHHGAYGDMDALLENTMHEQVKKLCLDKRFQDDLQVWKAVVLFMADESETDMPSYFLDAHIEATRSQISLLRYSHRNTNPLDQYMALYENDFIKHGRFADQAAKEAFIAEMEQMKKEAFAWVAMFINVSSFAYHRTRLIESGDARSTTEEILTRLESRLLEVLKKKK